MIRGFKMHLYPGKEAEYKKRHDNVWPEMQEMIRQYGGCNYSIFLDRETGTLFAVLEVADPVRYDQSAETAICQKWWAYMKDLMETHEDNSPVSEELTLLFHLD